MWIGTSQIIKSLTYAGGIREEDVNLDTNVGTIIPLRMMLNKTGLTINSSPFEERPSKPRPKAERNYLRHQTNENSNKNYYRNYCENKLMLSNDIEEQPGPVSTRRRKVNHTHILTILIVTLVLITKIQKESKTKPSQKKTTMLEQSQSFVCNLLKLKTKKNHMKPLQERNSVATVLALLLILAGDVHPNPGPMETTLCSKCKSGDIAGIKVTCGTCNRWCHIQCTMQDHIDLNQILEKSFQWICPNRTCNPNHYSGVDKNVQLSPNRYKVLQDETEDVKRKEKTKAKLLTKQIKERKTKSLKVTTMHTNNSPYNVDRNNANHDSQQSENLLNQLTKISSDDYIGKEICRACNKVIGKVQKAISCDSCMRWTHLKCSDMVVKTYNLCKNTEFPWICNTCRTSEVLNQEKLDVNRLNPEQMPLKISSLSPDSPSNFLVLHYNCRSFPSKMEEVHNICRKLEPSIICLTETWLDESAGPEAYLPDGYSIIRRDRNDEFKQKYGKNNGGGVAVLYKKELKIRKLNKSTSAEETL